MKLDVYIKDHKNVKTSIGAGMGSLQPYLSWEETAREFSGKQWQMLPFTTKVHFYDTDRAECLVIQKVALEILVC